jgi:hypothetical protein
MISLLASLLDGYLTPSSLLNVEETVDHLVSAFDCEAALLASGHVVLSSPHSSRSCTNAVVSDNNISMQYIRVRNPFTPTRVLTLNKGEHFLKFETCFTCHALRSNGVLNMSYIQMKVGAIFAGRIYKFASPPTCWDTSVGNVTSDGLMTGVRLPTRELICTFCSFGTYKLVCMLVIIS